jgi:hypothetical protein
VSVTTDEPLRWLRGQLPERELDERIAALDREIAALARARDALKVARNALNMAAEAGGFTFLPAQREPSPTANGYRPTTATALRTVFAAAPDQTLTVTQVMQALEDRGWLPDSEDPRKLVQAGISSLVHRSGDLEPTGARATYRLVKRKLDPPTEADGSQGTTSNRLFIGSVSGEADSEAS